MLMGLALGRFNLKGPPGTRKTVFADQYLSRCLLKYHWNFWAVLFFVYVFICHFSSLLPPVSFRYQFSVVQQENL